MASTYISFFRNWVLHRFDRRISSNAEACYIVIWNWNVNGIAIWKMSWTAILKVIGIVIYYFSF
jgi:hypothetical protein